jgi:methylamine--corrinoid protein Co-methyltransferase
VHLSQYAIAQIMDVRYAGNTGREANWVMSVVYQALSRNTDLLICGVTDQLAGPCTEMLLYETAVCMLNMAASGVSGVVGPRSAGGKHTDHISPLECKFLGEVAKRSSGLTRKQANDITKVLLPEYESRLADPPKGKKFVDCFDLRTLKPTSEWQEIYLGVKKELIELGVPLSYP